MKKYADPEPGYVGYPNVDLLPYPYVRVARDLRYWSARFKLWITIKEGYVSDLLTVPWAFRWLLPKAGQGRNSAILHDYLCDDGKRDLADREYPELSSVEVHSMFEESLIVSDIPRWRRILLAEAVKRWGPRFPGHYVH